MTENGAPLPTFLILGAPKCGTTTLHEVLRSRADVFMSPSKDPTYFELDEEYEHGRRFYREAYFQEWNGEPVVGEARPTKLMLPYVPERVQATVPEARLVAILRDPVERLYSHWWMRTCSALEPRPLAGAIRSNLQAIENGRDFTGAPGRADWARHARGDPGAAPVYLEFGYYADQLERYLTLFPPSQIKVLLFDDLRDHPAETFSDLLRFVGADPAPAVSARTAHNAALPAAALPILRLDHRLALSGFVPRRLRPAIRAALSRHGRPPAIDRTLQRELAEHYERHNEALARLIGRDLSRWGAGSALPA